MYEDPTWIHWNSIRLRTSSHVTSHDTQRHVTTLHDYKSVLWHPFDTSFGLSQSHALGFWLVCVVALVKDLCDHCKRRQSIHVHMLWGFAFQLHLENWTDNLCHPHYFERTRWDNSQSASRTKRVVEWIDAKLERPHSLLYYKPSMGWIVFALVLTIGNPHQSV